MNDQTRVLVTGSDGFIGRHLVPYLAAQGYKVIAASRTASAFEDPNIVAVRLPDLSLPFDWQPFLQHCDAVVHLAGIAHQFAFDDLYDRVNHQATAALADAACRCGTNHLVFVSSIAAPISPGIKLMAALAETADKEGWPAASLASQRDGPCYARAGESTVPAIATSKTAAAFMAESSHFIVKTVSYPASIRRRVPERDCWPPEICSGAPAPRCSGL